jgi:phospholipid transport system transporter-binding protein
MTNLFIKNNIWYIEGELNFQTVVPLLKNIKVISKLPKIIDLQKITRADSAGLALLIEILHKAHQQNINLNLRNIPQQLLNLAKISDVKSLISTNAITYSQRTNN